MAATFTVNGLTVAAEQNMTLLKYLRDVLYLTSCKDGCSEGACGTCTVVVDGKAVKACTLKTDEMEGRSVLTCEGLTEFEQQVFVYAFGTAGAVQCGFCIPGMVMCAKALLDVNPTPTEEEIRHALRYNICRCTGYVKIVKAIELAAEIFRSGVLPAEETEWRIGSNVPRLDVKDKVLGTGTYADDLHLPGMIYGSAVRSKYPRARVLAIRTEKAKALPGVVCVLTSEDIPGVKRVGHLIRDWDVMIPVGQVTHYLGDAIAIVAAETEEILSQAKALVEVDYEVLPPIFSPYDSMKPDAPKLHDTGNLLARKYVSRGDAQGAIASAPHVISGHFTTPYTEHAFLEPECAVAEPWGEDGILLHSTDQSVYDTQHETCPMLAITRDRLRVENKYVGGGFGGKEDVTVQHHAALITFLTGRPCKCKLTREESLLIHPKRHPMDMDFTLACDDDGRILGVKAKVISDTGAYASLGGPVLERACTHAAGPYNYQNFEIEGLAYYTNNPPAGAFRGFGVTQTCFCIETLLSRMARKLGISPWEIRYRNAIRPGQTLPNGQIVDESTGLAETLEAVKDIYEQAPYAGIACAMKNAGVGVGIPDTGRVRLKVEGGKLHIHSAASCLGQGIGTVLKQIVGTDTGLSGEDIVYDMVNTFDAPDSGTSSGSRQTTVTGEACRRACVLFNDCRMGRSLAEMEGEEYYAEYLARTDPLGSRKPNPVSHVAYGYATQVAILNEDGTLREMVAAHDVGRAINPRAVEGQIEGGVVMSMGYALTERYPLENGKPTATYGSLGLFRADKVCKITPIIVEKQGLRISHGAIGIGEITSIPTAPAIADAYFTLTGVEQNDLPLKNTPYARVTPEKPVLKVPGKRLTVRKGADCIGCLSCVRACAATFAKQTDSKYACLRITEKNGAFAPAGCVQCGKCAKACPNGAIKQNPKGVYMVDKKLCTNCGACKEVCPFHVLPAAPEGAAAYKCIACGKCAAACPMDVLAIAEGN